MPLFSTAIYIYNNGGLNDTASSGNGTQINPYIIENLTINGGGANGIYIGGTIAFFILRNCLVFNKTMGIQLVNVQNGIIQNNTLTSNGWGIYILHSNNILFMENNLTANRMGILIQESNNTMVGQNNVTSSKDEDTGIYVDESNNITVLSNNIYNGDRGVCYSQGMGSSGGFD